MKTLHAQQATSSEYVDLKEAAALLSVSTATVRNWLKTEKLTPIQKRGPKLFFNKEQVLQLKCDIESGKISRLRQRRNKRAVDGRSLPGEYVESEQYVLLAEAVSRLAARITAGNRQVLVLAEVALVLLWKREKIACRKLGQRGLLAQYLEGRLQLGPYRRLIDQLLAANPHPLSPTGPDWDILAQISQLEIPFITGEDFLGLVYLSLTNMSKRKHQGSYYTPTRLVRFLVEKTLDGFTGPELPRVIDPCCGSGNFLIQLFLRMREHLLKDEQVKEMAQIEAVVVSRLAGLDIDPIAVALARLNLALHMEGLPPAGWVDNIAWANALDVSAEKTFDIVIGNPPWGYRFDLGELARYRSRYKTAQSSGESFTLFIELGLMLLREGGLLSYILPESMLFVKKHATARKLLLQETELMLIKVLGEAFSHVFSPACTLLCRKRKINPDHSDHRLTVIDSAGRKHRLRQARFRHNTDHIFNVLGTERDEALVDKLKHCPGVLFLKGYADFALGIVTGDNARFIQAEEPVGGEPVLRGSDVFRYNYYPGNQYICFEPEKFQQVAPERLYRAKEKLIYRFISSSLVFAYDDSQMLSLNSANLLIPRLSGYEIKYILAVLNSRAAQFFHTFSHPSVKVLRKHIESIPIPPCPPEEQRQIVEHVDRLMVATDPELRRELYEVIDEQVFKLFDLTRPEQERIREQIGEITFLYK